MNALDQLDQLLRYAEQSKADLAKLKAEVAALQERVRNLEGAPAAPAPSKRRASEPAAPPPPRPEPVIHVRRETPPSPASQSSSVVLAWTATLLARYSEAVLDLSAAGESFIAAYRPASVSRVAGSDDYTVGGDPYDAMLWAVRAEGGGYALVPGYKAINNWSGHFAPNRTTTAVQYFGGAFDLEPGSSRLTVAAPAVLAETTPGRLAVRKKGRLSGFRA